MRFKLRDYQQECVDKVNSLGAGNYLICMATGLGKTVTFANFERKGRTLILAHREELIEQPKKYFNCSTGVEMAKYRSNGEDVILASVQSLVRRLDRFDPNSFDRIITDECLTGDTEISVKKGFKLLKNMEYGDMVASYNHDSGKIEYKKVTHVFKNKAKEFLRLNFEDGISINITENHPLFVHGIGYIDASKMEVGQYAMLYLQDWVRLESIEVYKQSDNERFRTMCEDGYVYNIEVEDNNNYVANGILVHNCHHSTSPTYRKIYDYFNYRQHIGVTATPNRHDKTGLEKVFERIIFKKDIRAGIKEGYLSDIDCLRVNIGYDLSGVARRLGDYAQNELAERMSETAGAIAEAYHKYAKGQTVIFATSVQHAHDIADRIDGAVAVDAKTNDRASIIKEFTARKIPCLTNCMVFTEGTDIPLIETIIIARPTQNLSLYTQMVGRGLRLSEGKDKLLLIDCVGASANSLCTAPSLIGVDDSTVPPSKRDEIQGDLFDLEDLIIEQSDVVENWILNTQRVNIWAKQQEYNTHDINMFKLPNGDFVVSLPDRVKYRIPAQNELGYTNLFGDEVEMQEAFDRLYKVLREKHGDSRAIWDLSVIKKWGQYPATDKQMDIIRRKLKRPDMETLTKLQAGHILNRIFNR